MIFTWLLALAEVTVTLLLLDREQLISPLPHQILIDLATFLLVYAARRIQWLGQLLFPFIWCLPPVSMITLISLVLLPGSVPPVAAILPTVLALSYVTIGFLCMDWRAAAKCSWWHLTFYGLLSPFVARLLSQPGQGTTLQFAVVTSLCGLTLLLSAALTHHARPAKS